MARQVDNSPLSPQPYPQIASPADSESFISRTAKAVVKTTPFMVAGGFVGAVLAPAGAPLLALIGVGACAGTVIRAGSAAYRSFTTRDDKKSSNPPPVVTFPPQKPPVKILITLGCEEGSEAPSGKPKSNDRNWIVFNPQKNRFKQMQFRDHDDTIFICYNTTLAPKPNNANQLAIKNIDRKPAALKSIEAPVQKTEIFDKEFEKQLIEFTALSDEINSALVVIYEQNPLIKEVIHAAVAEISKDFERITYEFIIAAAKKGAGLTTELLYALMTSNLGAFLGDESAKKVSQLTLCILSLLKCSPTSGFDAACNAANPAYALLGGTLGIAKLLDLPLKIFLLDGFGKEMVAKESLRREEMLDQFFAKSLEDIGLTRDNIVEDLAEECLLLSYDMLKIKMKPQLKLMMQEGFTKAHEALKKTVTNTKYEKYFKLTTVLSNFLYSGTNFPDSPLGKLTNQLLLQPLNSFAKGAQTLSAPVDRAKAMAFNGAFEMGKVGLHAGAKVTQTFIHGSAFAIDGMIGFTLNDDESKFAMKFVLYIQASIANAPKQAVEYVAARQAKSYAESTSQNVSRLITMSLIPRKKNETLDYTALLQPYRERIDPLKLLIAEQVFLNGLKTLAQENTLAALNFVDRKIGQHGFNLFLKLRQELLTQANIKEEDQDGVIDCDKLQRIFNPEDQFNIENALRKCQEIVLEDLVAFLNKKSVGAIPVVTAITACGLFLDHKIIAPTLELRKQIYTDSQIFIQQLIENLRSDDSHLLCSEAENFMTFREATQIFLQQRTKDLIHAGGCAALTKFSDQYQLGLAVDYLLLDKPENKSFLGSFLENMSSYFNEEESSDSDETSTESFDSYPDDSQ